MSTSSKKISRLEKEAYIRAKEFEDKREKAAHLLTDSHLDDETFESDRHRRHEKMRQTRQIQREISFQVGQIDKLNERRQTNIERKKVPTTTTTTRNNLTSLPSTSTTSSITDRTYRNTGTTETYTSSRHTSGGKF